MHGIDYDTLKPLHNMVLVELETIEQTDSGILIPEGSEDGEQLLRGIIRAVGDDLRDASSDPRLHLAVGVGAVFDRVGGHDLGESWWMVTAAAILATYVSEDGGEESESSSPSLLPCPEWEEFRRPTDYEDWQDWTRISSLTVIVKFLQPHRKLAGLATVLYEFVVEEARRLGEVKMHSISLGRSHDVERNASEYRIEVEDSRWGCFFLVSEKDSQITFHRQRSDFETLTRALPFWMGALGRLVNHDVFSAVAGPARNRLTHFVVKLSQEIRIEGRGTRKLEVRNSDLMTQFLHFEEPGGGTSTLSALGVSANKVKRTDLKLGWDMAREGGDFKVFVDIQAPSDDSQRRLTVSWEVQDHAPGALVNRDYSWLMTEFFRDRVLRGFMRHWFQENDDVTVITL